MFLYNLCCDDTDKRRKVFRQTQCVKKTLTQEGLAYLENKDARLQDMHMAVAGSLIKKKFPTQAGFQSTLYSCEQLRPQEEGAIQFHFDLSRQHWTTSTYSGGTIRYFDSLNPGYL